VSSDPFAASLEQSAASHPLSKARRIAALLPQIEAAMASGSTRSHIVTALLGVGIAVSPHQLSNAITRLRKRRDDALAARPVLGSSATLAVRTQVASITTLAPAPNSGSASRFGAHDPRLLDEVMRSTPDMKALAKLAPKSTTQGKP
jgi:uncharacterized membrane protein